MKNIFRPNYLRLGIILIALLLSSIITLTLYLRLTPWNMELIKTSDLRYGAPAEFRDLNHDGFSEFLLFANDNRGGRNVHYIVFYNYDLATIDQCNTREYINPENVFYGDYTGDGFDECFVFTAKEDSVFLYVFNVIGQNILINRQFVISIPKKHNFWQVTRAQLYDINGNSRKELLFTLHPGLASKPRGLYVFDLEKKTIINRFENQSSKDNFLLYDLTGDGSKEIIVLGKANGNGPKDAPFTDHKNWVFILDHNLKLKFPPLSYGAYPSAFKAIPVQIQDKPYLLIAHYRVGAEFVKKPLGIYLVDSRGRFERRQYFPVDKIAGIYTAVDDADNPRQLFMNFANLQLARYDIAANTLMLKDVNTSNLRNMMVCDTDLDGRNELLVESHHGIQIFDPQFNLLAKTEVRGPVHLSLRRRGQNLPPEIGASGEEHFYHFQVVSNPLFNWLPILFILLFGAITGLLLLSNMAFTRTLTFFNYFIYSIKHTANAVVLLKPNGRIYYFNAAAQKLLNGTEPFHANQHFQKAFITHKQITESVSTTIQSGQAVHKDFILNKENLTVKGELRVIPFKTVFNYIYAYLLEIKDFTEPVMSERHRVWSRTIQKMAHDIKTPIAAVQLNLETLQMKIADLSAPAARATEEDFVLIQKELTRINELTRQFLKFSNLEKPKFTEIRLTEVIQRVQSHFMTYFNDRLSLKLQIDADADLFWADAQQLAILFQIFVENAIDALKGKGIILISAHSENDVLYPHTQQIVIEVADNGPGIPEQYRNKIYEPYFTTKQEGNGMGLAIAQKIVYDHRGNMELISKKGFGAVFRIILPKSPIYHNLA